MRRRAEIVERSFAHNLDRGGMRRTWLRGRENVHKRYLVHVAGHNLGTGAHITESGRACGPPVALFQSCRTTNRFLRCTGSAVILASIGWWAFIQDARRI
jgi:hypothetical protein